MQTTLQLKTVIIKKNPNVAKIHKKALKDLLGILICPI